MFIDTQIDAGFFLFVTFIVGEFFLGYGVMAMFDDAYHQWHKHYHKLIWMPGMRLVPVLWAALAISVEASIYTFLKHLYPVFPVDTYVVPTVAVLFIIHLWLHRLWTHQLVIVRNPTVAMVIAFLMVGCGIGILVVFGLQQKYVELGCYVAYVVWSVWAFWLSWHVRRADHHVAYQQVVVQEQGPDGQTVQVYEMNSMMGSSPSSSTSKSFV